MKTLLRNLLSIAVIAALTLAPTGCVSASYRAYKLTKRQMKKMLEAKEKAAAEKAMQGDSTGIERQPPPPATLPQPAAQPAAQPPPR